MDEEEQELVNKTLKFKAVMVLPVITRNFGYCRYGNYVGNALRRLLAALSALSIELK